MQPLQTRIHKIHKNAPSNINSYCTKMIKMYRTEVCIVNSNFMYNRIQRAVMFKNLSASIPIYPLLKGCHILRNIFLLFWITYYNVWSRVKHTRRWECISAEKQDINIMKPNRLWRKKLTLLKKYKAKLRCQCTTNRQCNP